MHKKQLLLFNEKNFSRSFGGNLIRKRKIKRPLATKVPIHLILRAGQTVGRKVMGKVFSYRSQKNVRILQTVAKKFHIKVYQSVFNYTHLHLIIVIPSREAYVGFVRVLASKLSSLAGLKRGELFSLRPFTRVANWGREFYGLLNYMKKNFCQAIGGVDVAHWEIPVDT